MTTKFENIKTTLFVTKEHYLSMRDSWKAFINNGGAKAYWVEDTYFGCGRTKRSDLTAEHHLLYCILRERDIEKAFTPPQVHVDKKGLENAFRSLRASCRIADNFLKGNYPAYLKGDQLQRAKKRDSETLDAVLKPFDGTVTIEMLSTLYAILDKYKIVQEAA